MKRFLVSFRSHSEGLADVHFVDVYANSFIHAVAKAKKEQPPAHPWVIVTACSWPRGCPSLTEAAKKLTGTTL